METALNPEIDYCTWCMSQKHRECLLLHCTRMCFQVFHGFELFLDGLKSQSLCGEANDVQEEHMYVRAVRQVSSVAPPRHTKYLYSVVLL